MERGPPKVLIIGAGFGGMAVARGLRKARVDVLVIDRNNYHTFQPLLYQVATAGLEPGDIAYAARGVFRRQKNVEFLMGEVSEVALDERFLWLADGNRIQYDSLVLATGAETNDFGVAGVADFGFGLKTMDDAVRIRNHILLQFEDCHRRPELIERGALTFVIVGGGATGVEVAGALTELFEHVLRKDFRKAMTDRARVVLVEQGDRLLPAFKQRQSDYALKLLEKRGVEVKLSSSISRVDARGCSLASGERIDSETVIWAAGVQGSAPAGLQAIPVLSGRRLEVRENLSVGGHPEVFVVGDLAGAQIDGAFLPQVAPTAIQQGRHVARQILAHLAAKPSRPFKYRDLGQMATIGRNAAVVELPSGLQLRGRIAWWGWLLLHLIKLIGFRNRLSIMVNWTWNYFTYDRTARLIFGKSVVSPDGPRADPMPRQRDPASSGGLGPGDY